MKEFMGKDFLLDTDVAKEIYDKYADMGKIPVLDYHCHINPQEIYEDRQFDNIAQVWLGGDHYKWRHAGRTCTSKDPSSFIFLCQQRSSTGSSVVHMSFTLDILIRLRTENLLS